MLNTSKGVMGGSPEPKMPILFKAILSFNKAYPFFKDDTKYLNLALWQIPFTPWSNNFGF